MIRTSVDWKPQEIGPAISHYEAKEAQVHLMLYLVSDKFDGEQWHWEINHYETQSVAYGKARSMDAAKRNCEEELAPFVRKTLEAIHLNRSILQAAEAELLERFATALKDLHQEEERIAEKRAWKNR